MNTLSSIPPATDILPLFCLEKLELILICLYSVVHSQRTLSYKSQLWSLNAWIFLWNRQVLGKAKAKSLLITLTIFIDTHKEERKCHHLQPFIDFLFILLNAFTLHSRHSAKHFQSIISFNPSHNQLQHKQQAGRIFTPLFATESPLSSRFFTGNKWSVNVRWVNE